MPFWFLLLYFLFNEVLCCVQALLWTCELTEWYIISKKITRLLCIIYVLQEIFKIDLGTDLKNKENNETIISPRILLFSCRTILIGSIREKQRKLYFLPIGRNKNLGGDEHYKWMTGVATAACALSMYNTNTHTHSYITWNGDDSVPGSRRIVSLLRDLKSNVIFFIVFMNNYYYLS